MASLNSFLSEEQFRCSVCLDIFNDPVTTPCGHNFCKSCITGYWDTTAESLCPMCKEKFSRRPRLRVNTFVAEVTNQFRGSCNAILDDEDNEEKKLEKTKAAVQQLIQDRQKKIVDIKHSVAIGRALLNREKEDSEQVFSALVGSVMKSQGELFKVIEKKQEEAEELATQRIKELEKEVNEIKQLSHTGDQFMILKKYQSLKTLPQTKESSDITDQCMKSFRKTVSQLEDNFRDEIKKLMYKELRHLKRYAVDVTLDQDTLHPFLCLSGDKKQVSHGDKWRDLPYNPKRFKSSISVLANKGYSRAFYFEVQVSGKPNWGLGVARESINKKEKPLHAPQNGYWTVWLVNGHEYRAAEASFISLYPRERPQKVGVFVDYEEMMVSFYDVEARCHIYSFSECMFNEKVYPFLSSCSNDDGENSAPLVLTAVQL